MADARERFVVEVAVGEGSTARIFRARDRATGAVVALKQFRRALLHVDELVRRFELEADLLARFDHDHILPLLDRGVDGEGCPWMAMPLMVRGSLADRLLREGPLPSHDLVAHAAEVLDALTAIHQAGIIHRDVKPENILVDGDGVGVLADFGISLDPRVRATVVGDRMGTPSFMAPEQYDDPASVTPRADLFSLGATLYVCLTRHSPMPLVVDHLRSDALAELDSPLAPVIARATAPKPADRYGSALEMSLDVASCD